MHGGGFGTVFRVSSFLPMAETAITVQKLRTGYQETEDERSLFSGDILIFAEEVGRIILGFNLRQARIIHTVNLANALRRTWRQVVHVGAVCVWPKG